MATSDSTCWLAKTEPETYSFATLLKEKRTNWNDVRNFQARNNLRKMRKGDTVLIYHSGKEKAVVGVAEVVKEGYADIDPEGGDWTQVDLKAIEPLPSPVTLATLKATRALADLPLIRQTQLSVMPITEKHFHAIRKLGGLE